jgi:hypothetical protein
MGLAVPIDGRRNCEHTPGSLKPAESLAAFAVGSACSTRKDASRSPQEAGCARSLLN